MAYNVLNYGGSRSVAPESYYNQMDQIDFKSSRNANHVGRDGGQTSIGRNGQQALSYYDPALS